MFIGKEGGLEGHFSVPHNLTGLPALSDTIQDKFAAFAILQLRGT
ncbi:hypothetical protein [Deinococcus alpinitundrae]|nr:hypothetical protein [Deinococcus alpinitundrae]